MMTAAEIAAITVLHDTFGLTAKEALVLLQLARGGIVEHSKICSIYCDNPRTKEIEARSAVKRIRMKLAHTRIRIVSHYGVGYELAPEGIKIVRQLLQGNQVRAA